MGDFMTMNLAELGKFDVVLYLGVLYHMEEPLSAIRRVASVTAPHGLAVIETEAVEIPGLENMSFCEFFPGKELNNDPSNWWAPNAKALEGFCRAAGFRDVTILSERPGTQRHGRAKAMGSSLSRTSIAKRLGVGEIADLSPLRYRARGARSSLTEAFAAGAPRGSRTTDDHRSSPACGHRRKTLLGRGTIDLSGVCDSHRPHLARSGGVAQGISQSVGIDPW